MKVSKINTPLFIISTFFCLLIIMPCFATSLDIPISQVSPSTGGFVKTDGSYIVFQSKNSGPLIFVYNSDGELYEKLELSKETSSLDALATSDGRVYYSEYDSSEPFYSRNESVYEYSILKKERRMIYSTTGSQGLITRMAADGDYIVFRGGVNEEELILLSLSSGTTTKIFTSNNWIEGLAIDGDYIVWGCERTDGEAGREIHVYSISSGEDYIIPESKTEKTYGTVDISGDHVTWTMSLNEPSKEKENKNYRGMKGSEIMLTDLISDKTESIEKNIGYSKSFISGNNVIYLKKPSDNNEIEPSIVRIYNISDGSLYDLKSDVLSIDDFKGNLILWAGEPGLSFFATAIGEPDSALLPSKKTQTPSLNKSPVGIIVIISAAMLACLGYGLVRREK